MKINIVAILKAQAEDIANEGHNGWGNTMLEAARQIEELKEGALKYHELIMAVERKFPNETRHETALRYIRESETVQRGPKEVLRK